MAPVMAPLMTGLRRLTAVAALVGVGACTTTASRDGAVAIAADSWLAAPTEALPPTLTAVGLYPDPADRDTVVDPAHAYTPAWPLWSAGTDKTRHLVLPEGTTIDNRERDAWQYPVGAVFFKTFADGARPIETRLLHRTETKWELAAYQWLDDGTDAMLLDGDFEIVVELGDDRRHTIPSTLMCRECHESSPDPVLGDSELQLAPLLGAESPLSGLDRAGLLAEPIAGTPRTVADHTDDETTRAVLGDFVGNCVHCHNGTDGPSSSFDLDPAVALANTVGQPTQSSASAAGTRIVAGEPGSSILFLAVSGEHEDPEIEPMPPVALDALDQAAIERLRTFILGLDAN